MSSLSDLVATILAVYGMAHLLVWEHGPYDILSKFRYFMGVRENATTRYATTTWGDLLNCELCTSVWLALPVAWVCSHSKVCALALAAIGARSLIKDWFESKETVEVG